MIRDPSSDPTRGEALATIVFRGLLLGFIVGGAVAVVALTVFLLVVELRA